MTAPSDFLRFVTPYAPTAADVSAQRYIVDSCIDFCMKTGIWRETLDAISIRANQPEFDLEFPTDSQLVEVTEVYLKERLLEAVAPDGLYVLGENWQEKTGTPCYFYNERPDLIRLVPIPNFTEKRSLQVKVKLAPTRNARELPDFLLERYGVCIGYGALSMLLAEPHQMYSDVSKAEYFRSKYEESLRKARREGQEGFNRARFRTRAIFY